VARRWSYSPTVRPEHDSTRLSYDAVARTYADHFRDELDGKPLDRALLAALVEQAGTEARFADLGCGPGHVAAYLTAEHGVRTVGIDLSATMIAIGSQRYASVEFRQGDLLELPAADGEFGAAICLYSIIRLNTPELPRAMAEVYRVLKPGGFALVSFHVGSEVRHREEWLGATVDVDFRFFEVEEIVEFMQAAGLAVELRVERAHYPEEVDTRRGYLLGRR